MFPLTLSSHWACVMYCTALRFVYKKWKNCSVGKHNYNFIFKNHTDFMTGKNILEIESKNYLPVIQTHNWTYRSNGLLPDLASLVTQVDRIIAKVFI